MRRRRRRSTRTGAATNASQRIRHRLGSSSQPTAVVDSSNPPTAARRSVPGWTASSAPTSPPPPNPAGSPPPSLTSNTSTNRSWRSGPGPPTWCRSTVSDSSEHHQQPCPDQSPGPQCPVRSNSSCRTMRKGYAPDHTPEKSVSPSGIKACSSRRQGATRRASSRGRTVGTRSRRSSNRAGISRSTHRTNSGKRSR